MQDFQSQLLLFTSIDIVGSTALKNKKSERAGRHPWLKTFEYFYDTFPSLLGQKCKDNQVKDDALTLWKVLGDEILLYFPVTEQESARLYIKSLKECLKEYVATEFQAKDLKLNLKGTCWLAGMPVVNTRLKIADEKKERRIDFLGPSIDIGFRLTKFANPNKIIISAELAYLITKYKEEEESRIGSLGGIFYDGDHELKGVLHGKPYPIFWISMEYAESKKQMKLSGHEACDTGHVTSYLEDYVQNFGDKSVICLPYIIKEGKDIFGEMPPEHKDILDHIAKESSDGKEDTESKSGSEQGDKDLADISSVDIHKKN